MTAWNLENDGDGFEQFYWPEFVNSFPSYEVFWAEFITPMTCRNDFQKNHPLWIHFRQEVSADLQNIAMAHYTIFRCLAVNLDVLRLNSSATARIPALFKERFDIFYTNLGTIADMVSNLFFFTAKIQAQFGLREVFIKKKEDADIERIFKDFVIKEYHSRLEQFARKKRPVIVEIHNRSDFLVEVLGEGTEIKNFNTFTNHIVRRIRNVAIHNPVIGSIGEKVPKPDKIEKYELWGDLFYKREESDFVEREQQFAEHHLKIQILMDALWKKFIPVFRQLTQVPEYKTLLGHTPTFQVKVFEREDFFSSSSPQQL
ncbi:MAG TPA: hypothetical protein PLY88_03575 [Candidatus Omnitrophota bacterium]|nr:hypothetical protein [Candidatus Omnitrophota bacterium]